MERPPRQAAPTLEKISHCPSAGCAAPPRAAIVDTRIMPRKLINLLARAGDDHAAVQQVAAVELSGQLAGDISATSSMKIVPRFRNSMFGTGASVPAGW